MTALLCDPRGKLPREAEPYRTIGPFDADRLPGGIRAVHRLKPGAWGKLALTEGALRFVWDDAVGGVEHLTAPAELVIPPQTPHHVEGEGPFTVTITFYAA
ncbi:DUF1971 domain-containing protein [Croceibacterium aestuarii]|uniref:DUF1971 domain-containing protein n=1 Tax=Croceibacterium aestuarii TaxID=3064139 RepID=UPI00272E6E94|nr:DUF1971 domain-containing protein [Croceibacterium sp. D39]